MGVKITGLDGVIGNINLFRKEIGTTAVRGGLRAAAKVYAEAERESAPVLDRKTANSTALEPGSLKEDIEVQPVKVDADGVASVVVGPGKRTRHVAGWVEYGHRLVKGGQSKVLPDGHLRGPGHEIGSVQPHAWLRPAYERSVNAGIDAFVAAAAKRLRRWMK